MKYGLTRSLIFLISWCCFSVASGQTRISGVVKSDTDGKPLAGLSVTVKPKASAVLLGYGLTSDKGVYQLDFKAEADSVEITVSGLSIKKQVRRLPNKSATLNFEAAYEQVVLKEVQVKPPKIRRLNDTLNYAVDQFTGKNDRTIGEVLKRMPGIRVADDGGISYNGKPINRFYIEDQDLLQGRYNLATNNVEARDVETVQVLENHQPVKALKDKEFVDQGAINLKLKDKAKNILTANTQLGAGVAPVLWNNEAFAMYFGKGRQFMGTYKGNNTGDDSAGDLKDFYGGGWNVSFPLGLGIQAPSGPGVGRKRYLLNRDNAFSWNNLWAYGKDYKLTANIGYVSDRQRKDSYSKVEQYLPGDSTLVIEERMKATERFHYIDANVKLNANKTDYYFDNSLKMSGDLQRIEAGTVENTQVIGQRRSAPYFRIMNDFSMIRNVRKMTFRVNSFNGYGRIHDDLQVQPLLYPGLFSDAGLLTGMEQSMLQKLFLSYNNIGFGLTHGRFKQSYALGANASLLQLNSALQSRLEDGRRGLTADSLSNDLNWNRYDFYMAPEYRYGDKKLEMTLKLPLNYNSQHSNDRIAGIRKNIDRLLLNPEFNVNYKIDLLWTLNGSAGFSQGIDGVENGFTGYIMQSYRYLARSQAQLPERNTQSYGAKISYHHPIKMIWASFSSSYYWSKTNLLYGNEFIGYLAVRRTLDIPNTSNGYNLSFDLSKGLEGLLQKISLSGGYNRSGNTQINQTEIVDFLNRSYSANVGVDGKLGEWSDFNYGISAGRSENRIKNDGRDFQPISSASQSARFNIFPLKGLIVNLKYEFGYNSAVSGSGRIMSFADAGIKYRLKKLDFTLEYNNVLNTKRYIAAAYSGIGSYYSSYELRPAQALLKVRFKIR